MCRPSSLQSKLRSIRTRLSRLQTVIGGQEGRRALAKVSKLHRSRLDTSFCTRRSGSSQLGVKRNLVEDSMSWNRVTLQTKNGAWISCARCALRLHYVPKRTARMTSVSTTVIGISAGGSETNVTSERQRLHSKSGEGHDCRSRGTEASKEEGAHHKQTIVYNTV